MKKSYLGSLIVATLLLSGCGGSSSGTDTSTLSSTTISVERGPILKAAVIDAAGQKARDDGNGKYTFATAPTYPIMATGGVIDIDRDGTVSLGDVVSDINLTTTAGSVITVATTLASNPATKAELDRMATDLNLTTADILSKTPSDSKEIEAISNIAYKYIKDNNITDLLNSNDTRLSELNITAEVTKEYSLYVNNDTHDFTQNESDLMDAIARSNSTAVTHLETAGDVERELAKIESELNDLDVEEVKNDLLTLKSDYEFKYGDLDYEDEGVDSVHYQGVACASCHSSTAGVTLSSLRLSDDYEGSEGTEGSEGGENIFTSGATIFTTLNAVDKEAQKAASNYTLRLVLESGTIQGYNIGRGTGNVNGTFNAGITTYTAEVLDSRGNVVNSSLPNSHDASRFNCNSCHSAAGSSGAPGRIVSFSYRAPVVTTPTDTNTTTTPTDTNTTTVPTDTNTTTTPTDTNTTTVPADTNTTTVPADTNTTTVPADTNTTTTPTVVAKSFANDVLPILTAKCQSCHGASGNFSITTSTTPYAGVTPFVDTTNATASSLLQKGSGTVGHGGGDQLGGTTSADYITIRDWISEGALNN